MKSRKVVVAWAVEEEFDPNALSPGTFEMHGREYPEIDRVDWVSPDTARLKLNPALTVFVDRLEERELALEFLVLLEPIGGRDARGGEAGE